MSRRDVEQDGIRLVYTGKDPKTNEDVEEWEVVFDGRVACKRGSPEEAEQEYAKRVAKRRRARDHG